MLFHLGCLLLSLLEAFRRAFSASLFLALPADARILPSSRQDAIQWVWALQPFRLSLTFFICHTVSPSRQVESLSASASARAYLCLSPLAPGAGRGCAGNLLQGASAAGQLPNGPLQGQTEVAGKGAWDIVLWHPIFYL
jgi:hypothetical protein